jgi:hypothetical protein
LIIPSAFWKIMEAVARRIFDARQSNPTNVRVEKQWKVRFDVAGQTTIPLRKNGH